MTLVFHSLTPFFIASLLTLIITAIILFGIRFYMNEWIRSIPIGGLLIAGTFAFFPLMPDNSIISQTVDAVTKAAEMFVLDLDYGAISVKLLDYPESISIPYQILLAFLNISAPVCTTVIILSFIGDLLIGSWIKYFSFQDRHVFSQLNEKTLGLARSMAMPRSQNLSSPFLLDAVGHSFTFRRKRDKDGRVPGLYIFCGLNRNEREENPYYEEARRSGFTIIDRHISSISPARRGFTNFFLISENGTENTSQALHLMDTYKGRKNLKIFVLSNETETEYLLDKKMKEHGSDVVNLHHINEVQLNTSDLLLRNPLFSVINPQCRKISMLIIGSGYLGLEALKKSLWCSRNQGMYRFEVTIIDKNIEAGKGLFIRNCPDLDLGEYDVTFHEKNIDADTNDLINHLEEKRKHERELDGREGCYNYILITTNVDDTNIKAALDIRSWYQRNGLSAHISLAIRDNQKYKLISTLKAEEGPHTTIRLFPYACISQNYSKETVLNNPMEHMGVCINAVYSETYLKSLGKYEHINYPTAIADWRNLNLQKKRSSMALALFIPYVLWMKGYSLSHAPSDEKLKFSDQEVEMCAHVEHKRWNTYMLTEGFYRWPYDDFMQQENQQRRIQGENVSIKAGLEIDRLHACIADWDTILRMDKELGTCYAEYDREFIRNIPNIISGFDGEYQYRYWAEKYTSPHSSEQMPRQGM